MCLRGQQKESKQGQGQDLEQENQQEHDQQEHALQEEPQPAGDAAPAALVSLPCSFQALLICNTYKGHYSGELDGPLGDGQNVKEWLKNEVGGSSEQETAEIARSIRLRKNVTGEKMSEEIRSLRDRVNSLKQNGEAPVVRTSSFSN